MYIYVVYLLIPVYRFRVIKQNTYPWCYRAVHMTVQQERQPAASPASVLCQSLNPTSTLCQSSASPVPAVNPLHAE